MPADFGQNPSSGAPKEGLVAPLSKGWGLSRREFLTLALAGLAGIAWEWLPWPDKKDYDDLTPLGLGRVTIRRISVRPEPSFAAPVVGYLHRDMVVRLLEVIESPAGPAHNPRWYRIIGGYVHSGYIQRVRVDLQKPWVGRFPETGWLGEISVPFTRAYRKTKKRWQKVYRLYYQAVFWVLGTTQGPDGDIWYRLWDELLRVEYAVPGAHIRLIPPEKLTPLSPEVPPEEKRILVNLKTQRLFAFEGKDVVFETTISSGIPREEPGPNGIPTKTPTGKFRIFNKTPSRHMGEGDLVSSLDAYELPGVPWVAFFHPTGVAFHGTYWHDNFGIPMSHGCVNMRTEEALWLYRWSHPVVPPTARRRSGRGTQVEVVE